MTNILLVEDDLVNQKIASQILSKWGMQVTIAQDGIEAIDVLQEKKFNLVLMDLNMPVMDGYETTEKIRASVDPYFRNIPILAYSASTRTDSKQKAEMLGMTDFISKPLDASEMHFKINQYIHRESAHPRPLRLRSDAFEEGSSDDWRDLADLMIKDLRDCQFAAYRSYYSGEHQPFKDVIDRADSKIKLIDDEELSSALNDLHEAFLLAKPARELQGLINKLNIISESIIKTLRMQYIEKK